MPLFDKMFLFVSPLKTAFLPAPAQVTPRNAKGVEGGPVFLTGGTLNAFCVGIGSLDRARGRVVFLRSTNSEEKS